MTDERLNARYRALATEEPSAILDDAIRAAARRGVSAGPWRARTRWTVPVSIAAVLVLSFGVVMRMKDEAPETVALEAMRDAAPPAAASAPASPPATVDANAVTAMKAEPPAKQKEAARTAPSPAPTPMAAPPKPASASPPQAVPPPSPKAEPALPSKAAAAPAAQPAPSAASPSVASGFEKKSAIAEDLRREPVADAARAAPAGVAQAPAEVRAKAEAAPETPERKLERIAELRRAGRHAEADDAFTRFRREHPDYKIPDALYEQVRPR